MNCHNLDESVNIGFSDYITTGPVDSKAFPTIENRRLRWNNGWEAGTTGRKDSDCNAPFVLEEFPIVAPRKCLCSLAIDVQRHRLSIGRISIGELRDRF